MCSKSSKTPSTLLCLPCLSAHLKSNTPSKKRQNSHVSKRSEVRQMCVQKCAQDARCSSGSGCGTKKNTSQVPCLYPKSSSLLLYLVQRLFKTSVTPIHVFGIRLRSKVAKSSAMSGSKTQHPYPMSAPDYSQKALPQSLRLQRQRKLKKSQN